MSKTLIDRPIYLMVNYLYAFLATNFFFLLLISPFIFFFYFADFTVQNILLYYVSLLLFGPAFAALLKTMDKLVKDKIIQPAKDFWTFFLQNFKTAFKYWLIQWTIVVVLIIDIYYANLYLPILSPIFLIFIGVCLFISCYAFPILTKFEVKIKNLFVISIYSIFRYIKVTLLNVSTLVAFGVIFYAFPSIIVLFFMSLLSFFIMYNLQDVFKLLEDQFSQTDSK
ncbi:Uncharacterized membrane protein YesL [Amphibacillus marinus]|uniref:Uncharacterized membrane protein YesL n=1 Tax=Amphibacillus marinus TaxID=872970 RepID=A0A1H8QF75_9BACI|nr:DUF624 domain-containing protein [Amphibacillus marinus]SEO52668.1 Uncharacterized membrane protein YesL [Amphibacillus marinus]